ncbi:MAG: FtsW/RodA/SpoVE family cell cycle protein [Chloroflexota bacterium]|nr:FtsW/RodA/SpoVE family cell cycle protein [Chloroflexota bacterium]
MLRTGRLRLVELELLIIPSLLILAGLTLVVLVDRGNLLFYWEDVYTAGAFIAALLFVHLFLTLSGFRGDQLIFPIVALLTGIGLVIMQRLDVLGRRPELPGIAIRQTIWVFIGVAVLTATVALFRRLESARRYRYTLAAFGVLLMLGLVTQSPIQGARLWYNLGVASFQPGEIFKVILVLFFASYLDERRDLLASEYRVGPLKLPPLPYLAPMLTMWGISMLVIVFLRDLGSALLFFGIFLAMLYAVTGRALYVWTLGGMFLAGSYLAYQIFPHVQTRFDTWLYPFEDPEDRGFQITQSLFALGSGGLYGSGLGYGSPDALPAVHTDFVFSAIAEELGLIGSLAVLGLYLVLVYRGFFISLNARNGFHQLVGIGLTTILGLQSFIIIAGDVKLIPLTGITLPFVSYGGSSLLANFVIAGLLLGISAADSRGRVGRR